MLPEIDRLDEPELSARAWQEGPLTWLATAVYAAVVGAMRIVVDRLLVPGPEQIDSLRRSAEPFLAGELVADPGLFLDRALFGGAAFRDLSTWRVWLVFLRGFRLERVARAIGAAPSGHWDPTQALSAQVVPTSDSSARPIA